MRTHAHVGQRLSGTRSTGQDAPDTVRLGRRVNSDDQAGTGIERNQSRCEHQTASLDRLRIWAMDGLWSIRRCHYWLLLGPSVRCDQTNRP
jgi:hypothetical protein